MDGGRFECRGRRQEAAIRVIAAVFRTEVAAQAVASELTRQYGLRPAQLRVAAFGTLGPDEDDPLTIPTDASIILAGRLDEAIVAPAEATIEARGGVIVSDVDERLTSSPRLPRAAAGGSTSGGETAADPTGQAPSP